MIGCIPRMHCILAMVHWTDWSKVALTMLMMQRRLVVKCQTCRCQTWQPTARVTYVMSCRRITPESWDSINRKARTLCIPETASQAQLTVQGHAYLAATLTWTDKAVTLRCEAAAAATAAVAAVLQRERPWSRPGVRATWRYSLVLSSQRRWQWMLGACNGGWIKAVLCITMPRWREERESAILLMSRWVVYIYFIVYGCIVYGCIVYGCIVYGCIVYGCIVYGCIVYGCIVN